MNWLDKKFAREGNVEAGGSQVWQRVRTAIEETCASFRDQNDSPTVEYSTENGHAVVVRVIFPRRGYPGIPHGIAVENLVRIVFENQKLITATLNDKSPKKFRIDADENECFLLYGDKKIDADGLSEVALSDALFKPPTVKGPGRIPRSASNWA